MADIVTAESQTDKNEPLYLRVRRDIAARIGRGEFPVGAALPSENELARQYGTTRLTVRSALDALVERCLVRRIQGKGAYVSGELGDMAGRGGLASGFRESMKLRGFSPSVRVLSKSKRVAGEYYASIFDIEPDDLLYSVRRLNSVDGVPTTIESALIPMPLFPSIDTVDITAFSLYETYRILGHPVKEAHQKLGITQLDAHDARLLHVQADTPAMVLECLTVDQDQLVIEYARSVSCGARSGFTYRF